MTSTEKASVGTGTKGDVVGGLAKGISPTGRTEMESPHRGSRVVVTGEPTKATQERKSISASDTPRRHHSSGRRPNHLRIGLIKSMF